MALLWLCDESIARIAPPAPTYLVRRSDDGFNAIPDVCTHGLYLWFFAALHTVQALLLVG